MVVERPNVDDEVTICIYNEIALRIDKNGFIYKGHRIEDAGRAHHIFMKVMLQMWKAQRSEYREYYCKVHGKIRKHQTHVRGGYRFHNTCGEPAMVWDLE